MKCFEIVPLPRYFLVMRQCMLFTDLNRKPLLQKRFLIYAELHIKIHIFPVKYSLSSVVNFHFTLADVEILPPISFILQLAVLESTKGHSTSKYPIGK